MGINIKQKSKENNNILFGRLEGSRITKRGFWACFSNKHKKRLKVFVGCKDRPEHCSVAASYGPQIMRLVSFSHVEVISRTTHAQNTVNMLVHREKHDEPWRPPSYHGRHSAPPPAPRCRNISQHAMQQSYVIKNRQYYH